MKVLHVSNVDLYGRRFNGYDLIADLLPLGIECKQAVLSKLSRNPNVTALMHGGLDEGIQGELRRVERRHSMNNLLYPWGRVLANTPAFHDADCVHWHLIHNEAISLLDLPLLAEQKRTVWTFHDPWPLTGHCIYPVECDGWMRGCAKCPHLDRVFAMSEDHADRMWRTKRSVYQRIDVDIVVASEFMRDMVYRSPLTKHFQRVHLIPFGIDASVYLANEHRTASRRALGIPEDDFVLFFRSTPSEFKGLSYLIDALNSTPPVRPTTLLTVDRPGLLSALSSEYRIVEMGWVEDETLFPKLYSACDAFIMPSVAEAFGLMAIEAMAAGRPVVCFEGTSLPAVTRAPGIGIAVPMGDTLALRRAIDQLASQPTWARERGRLGQEEVRSTYSHETYLHRLSDLYKSVSRRGD